MPDCGCDFEATNDEQRQTLRLVLAINAVMFVAELVAGLLADSTGLIADSLDMLADASVYAISLFAVGRAANVRSTAATISGVLQMTLGAVVMIEAVRRFYGEAEPIGGTMIGIGFVALVANAVCLRLLWKHRGGDVNFRASFIFSTNDVIANIGVIVSGALVLWTGSQFPDLAIGMLISLVVFRGGVKILGEARRESKTQPEDGEKRG
ncbi:cation diffusion facilitator family transporter [Adhaeretor mobilis]|uniref:Cadmium, cobalt and zinc/H(+)-K(+) antiporter n=1 Tax=Adhaeretor mobilis TaxID=1930276 RepID=A0A517MWK9_9BACT|nr:cation diffusion facilitator family transporter [Adhaeretor mobilis]QDS99265.1 Cadmium, cobalt and zinc/H(+)-K(+) antiporter [Adhaeretor mobilis]